MFWHLFLLIFTLLNTFSLQAPLLNNFKLRATVLKAHYGKDLLTDCSEKKAGLFRHFLKTKESQERLITIDARRNTNKNYLMSLKNISKAFTLKPAFKSEALNSFFPYTTAPGTLSVTMNYANARIFNFGKRGGSLAQDEMQVLEIPELGLIREFFNKKCKRLINTDQYSVIIHNVHRVFALPERFYGRAFQDATPQAINTATATLSEPQQATILTVVAPFVKKFQYYRSCNIRELFRNIVIGFSHIRYFANKKNLTLTLHSGPLGAGAFGNNKIVSLLLQCIAAQCVATSQPGPEFDLKFFATSQQEYTKTLQLFKEFKKAFNGSVRKDEAAIIRCVMELVKKHDLRPHQKGTGTRT